MRSEIYAEFTLTSERISPDEITAILGIQPSRTWRVGDQLTSRSTVRVKTGGWTLKSGLPLSTDLETHTVSLLEQLSPVWDKVISLGTEHEAIISCVVSSYDGDRPALVFESSIVKKIAELHAAIDIDLYIFDED